MSRDIAIFGFVRSGGDGQVPGAVVQSACPVDEDEEDQIMRGDD